MASMQLLAHAHQRGGAAGREIEAAEQFLPARLRGQVHLEGDLVGRIFLPGRDGGAQAGMIGTEIVPQRLEEGDPRTGRQLRVAIEDFARQRHPGGLAAARQELPAQLDQIGGPPFRVPAPVAGAVESARPRSEIDCSNSPKKEVFTGPNSSASLAHEIEIW